MTDWYVHVAAQLELLHSEVSSRKHICKGVGVSAVFCARKNPLGIGTCACSLSQDGGVPQWSETNIGDPNFHTKVLIALYLSQNPKVFTFFVI